MTSTNKTKYKIKNKGYSNRSGHYRADNGKIAFGDKVGGKKEYTETDKFLKLNDEYLRNDDEWNKKEEKK